MLVLHGLDHSGQGAGRGLERERVVLRLDELEAARDAERGRDEQRQERHRDEKGQLPTEFEIADHSFDSEFARCAVIHAPSPGSASLLSGTVFTPVPY